MSDAVERRDDAGEAARRQHEGIAAGEDDLPDLRPRAYVGECRRQLGSRERLAARPHSLAAEAEAAIDWADMDRLEQHAVAMAVDDALDRRVRLVADRIGAFFRRGVELGRARHELRGYR